MAARCNDPHAVWTCALGTLTIRLDAKLAQQLAAIA